MPSYRIRSASLIIAALAVGSAITAQLPSASQVSSLPFERHGSVGQAVNIRTGTIQVTQVAAARSASLDFSTYRSQGLLLVLTVRHQGRTEPNSLSTAYLLDSARRRYRSMGSSLSTCTLAQPGLAQQCGLTFEVDPASLVGATAQFPAEAFTEGDGDDVAVIDLGITADQIASWSATTAPLSVPKASIVGEK